jgi:hypothetical protein
LPTRISFCTIAVLVAAGSLAAAAQTPPPGTSQSAAAGAAAAQTSTTTPATPTTPPCSNCFASIGAGTVLNSTKFGDYNDSSNILESTHLGAGTPQYAVGLSYKLPIYGPFSRLKALECTAKAYNDPISDAASAYCFPFKAFVSFKFTPDASQTFNGFTFGLSHSIAPHYLDLMVGVSYTAFNEVSPGFQQAAVNVVATQQAANNPNYAQYNLTSLKADGPTAYDGFPVQLINASGTPGALIYSGDPLVAHYHTGLFLGVSVPVAFKTFLGSK